MDRNLKLALKERWLKLWDNHPQADRRFCNLVMMYERAGLEYHNLGHIDSCLSVFDRYVYIALRKKLVEIALWYHDVICSPLASDNERQSAFFAADELQWLGLSEEDIRYVRMLIMATDHKSPLMNFDAQFIAAVDLHTLGMDAETYACYSTAIRSEYVHVTDDDYRIGRSKVLAGFIARNPLYLIAPMNEEFGERAKENMKAEIESLRATRRITA